MAAVTAAVVAMVMEEVARALVVAVAATGSEMATDKAEDMAVNAEQVMGQAAGRALEVILFGTHTAQRGSDTERPQSASPSRAEGHSRRTTARTAPCRRRSGCGSSPRRT